MLSHNEYNEVQSYSRGCSAEAYIHNRSRTVLGVVQVTDYLSNGSQVIALP